MAIVVFGSYMRRAAGQRTERKVAQNRVKGDGARAGSRVRGSRGGDRRESMGAQELQRKTLWKTSGALRRKTAGDGREYSFARRFVKKTYVGMAKRGGRRR